MFGDSGDRLMAGIMRSKMEQNRHRWARLIDGGKVVAEGLLDIDWQRSAFFVGDHAVDDRRVGFVYVFKDDVHIWRVDIEMRGS